MSDAVYGQITAIPTIAVPPTHDEERPPPSPGCDRRLVILATHWAHDQAGKPLRRQLWGCPHGHATAYRVRGVSTTIELLDDVS